MAAIKGALTEAGLLAFVVENRIHVVPPCTITAEQVAQGLAILMRSSLALPVWRSREGRILLPGGALAGPTGCEPVSGSCRPGKAQPPPAKSRIPCLISCPAALRLHGLKRQPDGSLPPGEGQSEEALQCGCLCYRWLQRSLRSRLIACVMSLLAQERRAASRRRPCTRAPASNIAAARAFDLSCRLRVGPRQRPCKTRPSARIHAGCPGLPERLSDVEAASPGSFSSPSASGDLGL